MTTTQSTPEGWQLVPIEPTREMLSVLTGEWHSSLHGDMKNRWTVMLASAPLPPPQKNPDDLDSGVGGGVTQWQPIETAPFEDVEYAPGMPPDKWLTWCLLGRMDEFGWLEWVGGMDAGMWLHRDDRRACGDSEVPTHWMPLPAAPTGEGA